MWLKKKIEKCSSGSTERSSSSLGLPQFVGHVAWRGRDREVGLEELVLVPGKHCGTSRWEKLKHLHM